jgi:RNA polymerase-binding transcription factor DksA
MNTSTYQQALEDEKRVLEGELSTVARRNPSNPGDWEAVPQEAGQESDPNDRADAMEGYGDNDILAALERIANGTYGTCVVSGEPIEEDRLKADPAAKTCKEHMNG